MKAKDLGPMAPSVSMASDQNTSQESYLFLSGIASFL